MSANTPGRRRGPLQSAAQGERQLDRICAELMAMTGYEGVITVSRVAEIMGWSVSDVREAQRYHNSWSVAEYAGLRGVTRQRILQLIHEGDIPAFKAPSQGKTFEFRIPKTEDHA